MGFADMGSSSSKPNVPASSSLSPSPSSSAGVPGNSRSKSSSKRRVYFQSSCLGSHDYDNEDKVSDHQAKENGVDGPCSNPVKSDSEHVIPECYRKDKVEHCGEMPNISSNVELDDWGQSDLSDTLSRGGSTSSRAFSSRSLNLSSRFLSRFSFFPGNVSFRLNRATSLGSSRPYPASSASFSINAEEHLGRGSGNGMVNRNGTRHGCDLLPACLINRSSRPHYEEFNSGNTCLNPSTSDFCDNMQDDHVLSTQDVAREIDSRVDFGASLRSPRNHSEIEGIETRLTDRRTGAREPVERNVRFSRTLSVGRLRDRVLRRSSFPDLRFCPLQQEREVRDASQGVGTGMQASEENAFASSTSSGYVSSSLSSSLSSSQDYEVESLLGREGRYRDLLEHRSNFLERRRRIRSQVRALQRLGSRFENLSGHERSCILSGQHRTGHCTCRLNNRDVNSNDDSNARASISRIVMLAEALFEVLDEIHQQSVVLSSRPSVSSLGSVPAPNEVVESLPVKLYSKLTKHLNEEAAQCYICLVEYEEGDSVRILPCHHEFHRPCIDKWLKEIHRICPLCRGDICRSDSLPKEN